MWQQIGNLFTTNQLIPVIFMILGLALCIIEIFMSKASNIGLVGGVVIISSMIAVMMLKGTLSQFIFLSIICMLIIVVAFCIATILKDKGISSKKVNIKDVSEAMEIDEDRTLRKLIGKVGIAQTEFNPNGKISLNSITLDAVTSGETIEKNKQIKIVKISGINVIVKEIEEANE